MIWVIKKIRSAPGGGREVVSEQDQERETTRFPGRLDGMRLGPCSEDRILTDGNKERRNSQLKKLHEWVWQKETAATVKARTFCRRVRSEKVHCNQIRKGPGYQTKSGLLEALGSPRRVSNQGHNQSYIHYYQSTAQAGSPTRRLLW